MMLNDPMALFEPTSIAFIVIISIALCIIGGAK